MLSDPFRFRAMSAWVLLVVLSAGCGGEPHVALSTDVAPADGSAAIDVDTAVPDAQDDDEDSAVVDSDTPLDSADDASVEDDGSGETEAADADTDAEIEDDAADGSGADVWSPPSTHSILVVGNSYTYVNDLPGVYATLALQAGVPSSGLHVESVTAGGYRLVQHAADAANVGTPPRLRTLLVVGTGSSPDWDVVVLQEQSQILGFPDGQPDHDASIVAGVELAAHAAAASASTVLYMTWGYRVGDPTNPGLYADYLAMQSRLEAGYRQLAEAIAAAGHPVAVAPVGPSFRDVHALDVAASRDPLADGSLFSSLYSPDNSHPSATGTYLAACVIAARTLGVDPTTLDGASPGVSDASVRDQLQELARDQVRAELEAAP
jgi:hypothetical protein